MKRILELAKSSAHGILLRVMKGLSKNLYYYLTLLTIMCVRPLIWDLSGHLLVALLVDCVLIPILCHFGSIVASKIEKNPRRIKMKRILEVVKRLPDYIPLGVRVVLYRGYLCVAILFTLPLVVAV